MSSCWSTWLGEGLIWSRGEGCLPGRYENTSIRGAGLIFGTDATLIATSKMKEKENSTHFKKVASRVGMKTLQSVEAGPLSSCVLVHSKMTATKEEQRKNLPSSKKSSLPARVKHSHRGAGSPGGLSGIEVTLIGHGFSNTVHTQFCYFFLSACRCVDKVSEQIQTSRITVNPI